jgi:uncharacterized protein (TIGR03085 family)
MGATQVLLAERAALCDTFDKVGADAPTLCEGWDTSDLAAHLLVRETRPDAALGILLPGPFARHMKHVMERTKHRGYAAMVDALRTGPPYLFRNGPMAAPNVIENWVHHEDVRRAGGEAPRPSSAELDELLWKSLGLSSRLAARRVKGVGLELRTPDGRSHVVADREPRVVLTGAPGELVLFMSGRKEAAVVEHEGEPEAVALVIAARFGI